MVLPTATPTDEPITLSASSYNEIASVVNWALGQQFGAVAGKRNQANIFATVVNNTQKSWVPGQAVSIARPAMVPGRASFSSEHLMFGEFGNDLGYSYFDRWGVVATATSPGDVTEIVIYGPCYALVDFQWLSSDGNSIYDTAKYVDFSPNWPIGDANFPEATDYKPDQLMAQYGGGARLLLDAEQLSLTSDDGFKEQVPTKIFVGQQNSRVLGTLAKDVLAGELGAIKPRGQQPSGGTVDSRARVYAFNNFGTQTLLADTVVGATFYPGQQQWIITDAVCDPAP